MSLLDVVSGNIVVNDNIAIASSCRLTPGMKKKTGSPYHHGNLRQEVLKEAERSLETAGYQNISLREISRALGVSHAAPRNHFADKEALLDALACNGYERLRAKMIAATKDPKSSFEHVMYKLGRSYVGFAASHAALMGLMFARKHDEKASDEIRTTASSVYSIPVECMRRGQAAGAVAAGDPARMLLPVFAALEGLIVIAHKGKVSGIPVESLVEEALEPVLFGLRPRK